MPETKNVVELFERLDENIKSYGKPSIYLKRSRDGPSHVGWNADDLWSLQVYDFDGGISVIRESQEDLDLGIINSAKRLPDDQKARFNRISYHLVQNGRIVRDEEKAKGILRRIVGYDFTTLDTSHEDGKRIQAAMLYAFSARPVVLDMYKVVIDSDLNFAKEKEPTKSADSQTSNLKLKRQAYKIAEVIEPMIPYLPKKTRDVFNQLLTEEVSKMDILKELAGEPIREGFVAKELSRNVKMPEEGRWHPEPV